MTVTVWRLVRATWAAEAFTGEGARRFGGRWNSPGAAVVYTSDSAALAVLEVLVHLRAEDLVTHAYALSEARFDDAVVRALMPAELPPNWQTDPAPADTKAVGDGWLADRSAAVLRVPSVVIPAQFNYLLNPAHPEYHAVAVGLAQPFRFDPRLLKS